MNLFCNLLFKLVNKHINTVTDDLSKWIWIDGSFSPLLGNLISQKPIKKTWVWVEKWRVPLTFWHDKVNASFWLHVLLIYYHDVIFKSFVGWYYNQFTGCYTCFIIHPITIMCMFEFTVCIILWTVWSWDSECFIRHFISSVSFVCWLKVVRHTNG